MRTHLKNYLNYYAIFLQTETVEEPIEDEEVKDKDETDDEAAVEEEEEKKPKTKPVTFLNF